MSRVVLVDNQAMIPRGVRSLLREELDIEAGGVRAGAESECHGAPDAREHTPREREVLALLGRGRSNREIADTLVVSEATAKTHVRSILSKLDLRDRVHAVVFAYESGIVQAGQD